MNIKGFHKKSEIIRNSSILVSGNILGQAVALAAYPLFTRIYSEAEFGVFATFVSVCGLLATLATGRYEEALVVAKDREETVHLLGFSLKILSVFSFILFAGLLVFRKPIFSLFQMEILETYWLYIPLTVFFTGLTYLLTNLAIREKQFKKIAVSNLSQNIIGATGKLLIGLSKFTQIGLIFSNLAAAVACNYPYLSLKKWVSEAIKGKWKEEQKKALHYIDFPIFNLARTFLSGFSINLPFLLLIGIFGETSLGLYSLAFTLLYRPINLIANSLYATLFENATSVTRERKPLLPSLKKYGYFLCLFILPCFVLAFLVAEPIFGFIFGAKWKESAVYFQYMLPWMFVMMAAAPVYFVPIIFNKQKIALGIEVIFLLLRWGALYAGIRSADFRTGILLFSIAGFIFSSAFFIWIYALIKNYDKSLECG